mgnify:CR=1 FL=1
MSDTEFLAYLKGHPELWDIVMRVLLEHSEAEDAAQSS